MAVLLGSHLIRGVQVNYFQAKRLLDEIKDGRDAPLVLINQALSLTGDMDDVRSDIYGGWQSSGKRQAEVCQTWEVCPDLYATKNQRL
jgi:hypothetical protein